MLDLVNLDRDTLRAYVKAHGAVSVTFRKASGEVTTRLATLELPADVKPFAGRPTKENVFSFLDVTKGDWSRLLLENIIECRALNDAEKTEFNEYLESIAR